MRRRQLIELHEQPWFPTFLRNDVTDTLQYGFNLSQAYVPVAPLLLGALDSTGSGAIVDLCSGAGGPWVGLARRIQWKTADAHILLTDKNPNPAAYANAQAGSTIPLESHHEPVDARHVPKELQGFRTMFTSFHHFPPHEARAIIQNAVGSREGIGIFEVPRRAPAAMLLMFLWCLAPLLFTPFIRPFRWSRLLYTYLLPIIPLVLLFDGVVSCLRAYRPAELREMIENLKATDYQWETGELRGAFLRPPVTYFIAYPRGDSGAGPH